MHKYNVHFPGFANGATYTSRYKDKGPWWSRLGYSLSDRFTVVGDTVMFRCPALSKGIRWCEMSSQRLCQETSTAMSSRQLCQDTNEDMSSTVIRRKSVSDAVRGDQCIRQMAPEIESADDCLRVSNLCSLSLFEVNWYWTTEFLLTLGALNGSFLTHSDL